VCNRAHCRRDPHPIYRHDTRLHLGVKAKYDTSRSWPGGISRSFAGISAHGLQTRLSEAIGPNLHHPEILALGSCGWAAVLKSHRESRFLREWRSDGAHLGASNTRPRIKPTVNR
jgi:hypothetical protein